MHFCVSAVHQVTSVRKTRVGTGVLLSFCFFRFIFWSCCLCLWLQYSAEEFYKPFEEECRKAGCVSLCYLLLYCATSVASRPALLVVVCDGCYIVCSVIVWKVPVPVISVVYLLFVSLWSTASLLAFVLHNVFIISAVCACVVCDYDTSPSTCFDAVFLGAVVVWCEFVCSITVWKLPLSGFCCRLCSKYVAFRQLPLGVFGAVVCGITLSAP